jgi:Bacterial Ig domain/Cellulase (glycosyl hydrolase family 5)
MRGHLAGAAIAVVALLAAPAALAGPSLHVGAVEDAAIWGNPNAQMDLAQQAGFDSIRMTAQWTTGATALPRSQMTKLQNAARAAVAHDIQPIVAIYNASSSSTPADDASRARFVQFTRSVVSGLPWVTTFIVGNEPNSNVYWLPQFDASGADVAAVAYEQLLAMSYDAIKALRPTATVVGGALDSRGPDDPAAARQAHSPTTFIRDLGAAYRASGRTTPIMDVFDQHVYADNSSLPPSMPHTAGTTIAEGDYTKLVSLLGAAFDGTAQRGSTLPIVYGEFGVETVIPSAKAGAYTGVEAPTSGAVDEATQARYYTEAFKLALCQPNVIGILVFHVVDESALSGWQSGPFYADGTPKSSLDAIRQAAIGAQNGTLASCPDRSPPTVTISGPAADGTVTGVASDDIGVGQVELVANGVVAGVKYSAPYTFAWNPAHEGRYVLELRASDAAGNVGEASLTVSAVQSARGKASDTSAAGPWTFGPPPANDLFAAAQRISTWHGRIKGSTAFATSEHGERARRSVWFTWRAPASGTLDLAASGTEVSVYTGGSIAGLHPVAAGSERVAFTAVRGTRYRIAVDGDHATFALSWRAG